MADTNESEKVQNPDLVHPSGDTSVREAAVAITREALQNNHHTTFRNAKTQHIKNTYRKQIPISPPLFFSFQCLYAKKLQYDYSLWCILGRAIIPLLDIPGRTIIPRYSRIVLGVQLFQRGSGEKTKKIIKFWFCGFIFVGLFSIFLMQFMELTVHSK